MVVNISGKPFFSVFFISIDLNIFTAYSSKLQPDKRHLKCGFSALPLTPDGLTCNLPSAFVITLVLQLVCNSWYCFLPRPTQTTTLNQE